MLAILTAERDTYMIVPHPAQPARK